VSNLLTKVRAARVEVSVILCRMQFTLGELAAIQPGDVLEAELEGHPISAELNVNGKTVAKGHLVIRDGLQAIEITEIGTPLLRRPAPVRWSRQRSE
jgi:flagellar motor switch/type III secretory pathway protein FliN